MDSDAPTIHMLRYMQAPVKTFREVESWRLSLVHSCFSFPLLVIARQIVNQGVDSPANAFPLS